MPTVNKGWVFVSSSIAATSPGGSDTQVQFNDGGSFGGDADFTWNKTANTLRVTGSTLISGDLSASANISASSFYGDGSNLTGLTASAVNVADGPQFSLQFRKDTPVTGEISGSANLHFFTASTDELHLTGNLYVKGNAFIGNGTGGGSIFVAGDTNTRIRFGPQGSDSMSIEVGGKRMFLADENGTDRVILGTDSTDNTILSGNLLVCNGTASISHLSGCSNINVLSTISSSFPITASNFVGGPTSTFSGSAGVFTTVSASNIVGNSPLSISSSHNSVTGSLTVTGTLTVTGSLIVSGSNTITNFGAFTSNEAGGAFDFRVESLNNQNMVFVDGSADKVGIGVATPVADLHVSASDQTLFRVEGKTSGPIFDITGSGLVTVTGDLRVCAGTSSISHLSGCSNITVHSPISSSLPISASSFFVNGSPLSATPGGSNTQIQFNDGGSFGGDADFTWNKTANRLTVTGSAHISGTTQAGNDIIVGSGTSRTIGMRFAGSDYFAFQHAAGRTLFSSSAGHEFVGGGDEGLGLFGMAGLYVYGDDDGNKLSGSILKSGVISGSSLTVSDTIVGAGNLTINGATSTFNSDVIVNSAKTLNVQKISSSAGVVWTLPSTASQAVLYFAGAGKDYLKFDTAGRNIVIGSNYATTNVSGRFLVSGAATFGSSLEVCNHTASIAHLSGCSNINVHAPISSSFTVSASAFYLNGAALSAGGGSVAGGDGQIQFNDGGSAFGADADFKWSKSANRLTITGSSHISASGQAGADLILGSGTSRTIGMRSAGADYLAVQHAAGRILLTSSAGFEFVGGADDGVGLFGVEGLYVYGDDMGDKLSGSILKSGVISGSSLTVAGNVSLAGNVVAQGKIANNAAEISAAGIVSGSSLTVAGAIVGAGNLTINGATSTFNSDVTINSLKTLNTQKISSSAGVVWTLPSTASQAVLYFAGSGKDYLKFDTQGRNVVIGSNYASTNVAGRFLISGSTTFGDKFTAPGAMIGQSTAPKVTFDAHYTGSLSPVNLSNDTGGGEVVYFGTSSANLVAGGLYYLTKANGWRTADASVTGSGHNQLLAIALGTKAASSGMLIRGFFDVHTFYSGSFAKGGPVYIQSSSAVTPSVTGGGYLSSSAPATSNSYVRSVGYATGTPNVIYFNPDSTYVELA